MVEENGLIQIYYGDGKGKTTAAIGQAIRALGSGYKVVVAQFLKDGKSAELKVLKSLNNVELISSGVIDKFVFAMTEEEREQCKEIHNQNLKSVVESIKSGGKILVVLDEVLDAYHMELLDGKLLEDLVIHKPKGVELVLTGHVLPEFFSEFADYISFMQKEKHPYDKGVLGREGIEY